MNFVMTDNIVDVLNSPDEGFLSMEDTCQQIAFLRVSWSFYFSPIILIGHLDKFLEFSFISRNFTF